MPSFADSIQSTRLMLEGLKTNSSQLVKCGATPEFIESFSKMYQEVLILDKDQATLKAQLKDKTDNLYQKWSELDSTYRKAKRMVKLEINQTLWREYGIEDQR